MDQGNKDCALCNISLPRCIRGCHVISSGGRTIDLACPSTKAQVETTINEAARAAVAPKPEVPPTVPGPSDPYVLLRRALKLLSKHTDERECEDWVDDYAGLPGAELGPEDLEVLRDHYRRYRQGAAVQRIAALLEVGYLQRVEHVGRNGNYHSIRLSPDGRRALRLWEGL